MSSLSVGIVGLPNAGKSTLFNSLLGRSIAVTAAHPFTTIDPNVGVVEVPDERLDRLYEMAAAKGGDSSLDGTSRFRMTDKPKKVPATIKFIDIAGLVKGAAKGEGLGNQFLAHIREVDVVCFVLRDFEDENVERVGSNPKDDLETLKTELILKDIESLEKNKEEALAFRLIEGLNKGLFVSQIKLSEKEKEVVKEWFLLTDKPFFVVLNVSENNLLMIDKKIKEFKDWTIFPVCAKLEEQLSGLSKEEQKEYLNTVGLKNSALDRLIKTAYDHLSLIRFYTIKGGKEISAWSIKEGANAINSAEVIHSDFADKFIKAEVINYQKLLKAGSWSKASQKGWLQLHGKDYEIQDGDVVEFKLST